MKSYEKYLCASAEFEVEQLKNSGQEFVLDKESFDPTDNNRCFYGQVFESCFSDKAIAFKKDNNIRIGFRDDYLWDDGVMTALEILVLKLWIQNKKKQVYKIVEKFATWKDVCKEDVSENLFTL